MHLPCHTPVTWSRPEQLPVWIPAAVMAAADGMGPALTHMIRLNLRVNKFGWKVHTISIFFMYKHILEIRFSVLKKVEYNYLENFE